MGLAGAILGLVELSNIPLARSTSYTVICWSFLVLYRHARTNANLPPQGLCALLFIPIVLLRRMEIEVIQSDKIWLVPTRGGSSFRNSFAYSRSLDASRLSNAGGTPATVKTSSFNGPRMISLENAVSPRTLEVPRNVKLESSQPGTAPERHSDAAAI